MPDVMGSFIKGIFEFFNFCQFAMFILIIIGGVAVINLYLK